MLPGAVLLSVVPSITGWCVLAIAQDAAMLYAGRVLTGLGMGVEGTVHPVYVCEVCSPGVRGPLAATGVIVITTGVLISYILGTLISWKLCAWIFLSIHVDKSLDNYSPINDLRAGPDGHFCVHDPRVPELASPQAAL